MEHQMIARVYALVAEMEAKKARLEYYKRKFPYGNDHLFDELADEMNGIASELQQLGHS